MTLAYKNLIGGVWKDSASGKLRESINPANTSDVVGTVPDSTTADVDEAVAAAREAYRGWRLVPAPKRGEILYRAAELLLKHKDELGRLATREMGKILPEGLGDVQEAIDMAYFMAGEGRRLEGQTVPSELVGKDCKSVREPIGVFALITPWNFPTAIPSWKLLPAIISGNCVVFKPSSDTPVCATKLVEILIRAGVPKGVVNMVHGSGQVVGSYLARHPDIDGISFTGSSAVGEELVKSCAGLDKEISCEMGGKNPIIVMDDARLDLAIEGALWGGFGTTGQRCTAASRVIVHAKVYDDFVCGLARAAADLRVGDGMKDDTEMGPLIHKAQMEKVLEYIKIGKEQGGRLVTGGRQLTEGDYAKGFFVEPTVFADVTQDMRIAREEIFGPVVSVIKARNLTEAVAMANDSDYGLSAAIFSQDVNNCATAERDLQTGIVYINAPTIGAEIQLPFGGIKKTGTGHKEAGGRGGALDMFLHWKVVYRDFSGRLQKAQIEG
ncbi:Aldehyde dehydrogenase B [hydrothermal vent metagenome]|uniref:Aldehyde dehydrogenase B n=1 Tax=hydrothermal vent metagenome TaxID=652676 RepID=A0A3B0V9N0_9ZZZZ